MSLKFFFSLSLSVLMFSLTAQNDSWYFIENETEDGPDDFQIIIYEKFNPHTGGDSLRLCNGRKCNGHIADKYPDGALMHKGYYTNGQLMNSYENYFENGHLERKFRLFGSGKGEMKVYYPTGNLRSEVIYSRKRVLDWKDYYPNGNLEYWEEYHTSQKFYKVFNFYFSDGTPQSTMHLVHKSKKLYDFREYHRNGKIMAEGRTIWIPSSGGYVRTGAWAFYDEDGNAERYETYHNGMIIDDDPENN